MDDRVQSEYKKYVDSRMEPSEEFLTRLKQTLREEAERDGMLQTSADVQELTEARNSVIVQGQPDGPSSTAKIAEFPRKRGVLPYFAAAAVLALVVGITAFSYFNRTQKSQAGEEPPAAEGTLSQYAGEAETKPGFGNVIGNPGWWDESLTAESLPGALAQKMEGALERLSDSEDNKFVDARQVDAKETARIIEMLREAADASEITGEALTGDAVYYMAVFEDGTVAKFRIVDEQYIVISGAEKVYQIKK